MSKFWQGRRVFVTGGTGMIGSWLVKELLGKNAMPVLLIHDADPQSELYRSKDVDKCCIVNGALEDYATVERAINEHEIDTVIHLGAQTIVGTAHRSPLHTFEVNIRGTYNIMEACRVHAKVVKEVVIASSDKAYGTQKNLPYTEEMSLIGRAPYEVSKSCADLIAQSYFHTYNTPVTIARCGNIYGGGDLNWNRIVPGTIRSLFHKQQPEIRSDGAYVRDYIFVRDIARAYMLLAEQTTKAGVRGEAFNFSTEAPLTVLQLVQAIQKLLKLEEIGVRILNQAEGEIHSQSLAAGKAKKVLGWTADYDLNRGLNETIDWYKAFLGF
ncbi:MAG: NAD-dependent epimerase/dehydratase family protein [Candidatus Melainabacteria bacterium]|nr:MAG: NAD-dependent epimerase/dehydratase family protein [Candidatus Melainabacteria bacterium]